MALRRIQPQDHGLEKALDHKLIAQAQGAIEKGETQGFMKIVVDAETREILGAGILGVGGDEAVTHRAPAVPNAASLASN